MATQLDLLSYERPKTNSSSYPQQSSFGTELKKLFRRGDPETSREAAERVNTTRLEELVHRTIQSFRAGGCISEQVRECHPGLAYSSVTARFKALEEKGLIIRGPDKRENRKGRNQLVMRSSEFVQL
jgi:DNA-binding MarR family transcriptional regulator